MELTPPLVPLVLGITGHPDIRDADRPDLEERVRGILAGLRRHYPDTPLVLFSALAEGAGHRTPVLALCALLLIVAGVVGRRARRREYRIRELDYRALAEGFRVQFYWGLVGLAEAVPVHYLCRQRGELDWIRRAIRILGRQDGDTETGVPGPEPAPALRLALREWVAGQSAGLAAAARGEDGRDRALERATRVAVIAGVLAGLALATTFAWPERYEGLRDPLLFVVVLSATGGALLHHYVERGAFREEARRDARASLSFAAAAARLAPLVEAARDTEAREVLRELGREALSLSGDRVLLHRERPLERPEAEGARAVALLQALKS